MAGSSSSTTAGTGAADPPSALDALEQIAFLLERGLAPTPRVKAFRNAAGIVADLSEDELRERVDAGTLQELDGIGSSTGGVIGDAVAGRVPAYLVDTRREYGGPLVEGGEELRAALRGDLHTHSDWSDGGSPIEEMARTAAALGHDYLALTDHSPRLTVAHGLTAARLRQQLEVVAELNERLAPFRILTGIECDILESGALDQDDDLLATLDVVVASVHSKLRMDGEDMTRRMVTAIANPRVDVLGHCTGRNVMPRGRSGKTRPESEFDAEIVFEACRQFDVAVEINSRPERRDPPMRLIGLASETGCRFSIDTDAHAPGQLDFLAYGCARADTAGLSPDRIVNTMPAGELLGWTHRFD